MVHFNSLLYSLLNLYLAGNHLSCHGSWYYVESNECLGAIACTINANVDLSLEVLTLSLPLPSSTYLAKSINPCVFCS